MCTRRHFLKAAGVAAVVGPAAVAESARAAAQARAGAATGVAAGPALFDFRKLAAGVYLAEARPALMINCNACVIVNEDDVMVVDTHSKMSAASALIRQIRRELTPKPVRYIINTHFHWDHFQGNHSYPAAFPAGVNILTSEPTRQLMQELGRPRLQASIDDARKQALDLRQRMEKATDAAQRAKLKGLIAEGEAYIKEMQNAPLDLPTTTFDRSMILHKKDREVHLMFLGRGHTGGDTVVFLPKEKIVATGDLMHGFLPYIGDAYPKEWPATLDKLRELDFTRVSPGHAGEQEGKTVLGNFRNYVEELTARVQAGIQAGKSVDELKKEITPASLRSLGGGYLEQLRKNYETAVPMVAGAPHPFDGSFAGNIEHTFARLRA